MSTYWIHAAIWLALAVGMAISGPDLVWLMFVGVACYFVARALLARRKLKSEAVGIKTD